MSEKLKDLVSRARDQVITSSLTEDGDRSTFQFGDATKNNDYPNASEYDAETNKNVGRKLQGEKENTVSFTGANFLPDINLTGALDGVEDAIEDTFGTLSPILRAFINNEDFVLSQTKLHSINKLSGKVFNPLGILGSYLDDQVDGAVGDTALSGLLLQTLSNIIGSGAFKTTDGETYYGVVDADAFTDIFTLEGLKNVLGGRGGGIISNVARDFVGNIAEGLGISIPTKSIVAQVLAYNNSLFNDVQGTSTGWLNLENSDRTTYEDNINPIGIDVMNYIYDSNMIVKDPAKYYELSQKISRGLMASNVMVKKSDDIIEEEGKALLKYGGNKVLDRLFGADIGKAKGFYINKREEYKPDEGSITDSLIDYFLFGISDEELQGSFDIHDFISNVFDSKISEGRIRRVEEERVVRAGLYGGDNNEERTDSEKLPELKEGSIALGLDYIDENDPAQTDQYRYHNIQVQLGNTFRERLKNKSFKELRTLSEELGQNDIINAYDIEKYGDDASFEIGNGLGTNHFMAIEDVGNGKVIYLRPTFENISEDIQINNGDLFYVGRTEPFPNYENTTRSITLNFKLYSDTPTEYLFMWKKMAFLNSLAYPTSADDKFEVIKNPLIRFTVGDVFKRVGGYLNTLNYVYSNNDTTWETEKGKMGPKIIDVSMSMTVLHDTMPYVNGQNDFTFDGENSFNPYNIDYKEIDS